MSNLVGDPRDSVAQQSHYEPVSVGLEKFGITSRKFLHLAKPHLVSPILSSVDSQLTLVIFYQKIHEPTHEETNNLGF